MTERKTYLFEMPTETYTPSCVACEHVERVKPRDGYAIAYRWTQPDLVFDETWDEFFYTYEPELKQLSWLFSENGGLMTIISDVSNIPMDSKPFSIIRASAPGKPIVGETLEAEYTVVSGVDPRPSMKRALANIEYITI